MNAHIIVDLTFGDSGKGLTTDYLINHLKNPIVVRFSGGPQAGHNVKINDVAHTHSNYGSGTLRGVPSFFSEHTAIYPLTMFREKNVLENKGIKNPKLTIHPLAKVITPSDVIFNRIRERKVNHGSCGLGVAATMQRIINTGYKLYAIDLLNLDYFWKKVINIADYYMDIIEDVGDKHQFNIEVKKELDLYFDALLSLEFDIQDYKILHQYENIVFEGSQGIMLDMDHGVFPNVTFANTTSKNAIEICQSLPVGSLKTQIYYITRCYQTRHGNGWMSNKEKIKLINTEDEINNYNEWQKDFRIAEIDYNLLNHALKIDELYSRADYNFHKNLVVTCLDQRPDFKFDYNQIDKNFYSVYESYSSDSKNFKKISEEWKKEFV